MEPLYLQHKSITRQTDRRLPIGPAPPRAWLGHSSNETVDSRAGHRWDVNRREENGMVYFMQMSAITLQLPDELAERLRKHEERLPEILELGLRELNADPQSGFEGATEILEFLAGLPSPEDIL